MHRQPRQEAQLHALAGDRVGARNDRLARDDGGGSGQDDHRQAQPGRPEQEERTAEGSWIRQHQRALAKIIQDQRGKHEAEPCQANRTHAEVPHIRVERLGAGHRQHHRT